MFNYMKEVIINDASKVVADGTTTLVVKRGGNYKKAQICDKKIYKTLKKDGSVGLVSVDFTGIGTADVTNSYIATIFVQMGSRQLADFALANWAEFGKPILVEFSATGTGADVADAFRAAVSQVMGGDNAFIAFQDDDEKESAAVKLETTSPYLSFQSVAVAEYDATAVANSELGDYVTVLEIVAPDSAITKAVEPFATAAWIRENLRFPSYPNLRYEALYPDEQPVAGATYTQYAFDYKVEKAAPGGLSAVGQLVTSVTQHIFYVKDDQVTAFENVLKTLNGGTAPTSTAGEHTGEYVLTLA